MYFLYCKRVMFVTYFPATHEWQSYIQSFSAKITLIISIQTMRKLQKNTYLKVQSSIPLSYADYEKLQASADYLSYGSLCMET